MSKFKKIIMLLSAVCVIAIVTAIASYSLADTTVSTTPAPAVTAASGGNISVIQDTFKTNIQRIIENSNSTDPSVDTFYNIVIIASSDAVKLSAQSTVMAQLDTMRTSVMDPNSNGAGTMASGKFNVQCFTTAEVNAGFADTDTTNPVRVAVDQADLLYLAATETDKFTAGNDLTGDAASYITSYVGSSGKPVVIDYYIEGASVITPVISRIEDFVQNDVYPGLASSYVSARWNMAVDAITDVALTDKIDNGTWTAGTPYTYLFIVSDDTDTSVTDKLTADLLAAASTNFYTNAVDAGDITIDVKTAAEVNSDVAAAATPDTYFDSYQGIFLGESFDGTHVVYDYDTNDFDDATLSAIQHYGSASGNKNRFIVYAKSLIGDTVEDLPNIASYVQSSLTSQVGSGQKVAEYTLGTSIQDLYVNNTQINPIVDDGVSTYKFLVIVSDDTDFSDIEASISKITLADNAFDGSVNNIPAGETPSIDISRVEVEYKTCAEVNAMADDAFTQYSTIFITSTTDTTRNKYEKDSTNDLDTDVISRLTDYFHGTCASGENGRLIYTSNMLTDYAAVGMGGTTVSTTTSAISNMFENIIVDGISKNTNVLIGNPVKDVWNPVDAYAVDWVYLINNSVYRWASGSSINDKFMVLEIEPCYPIETWYTGSSYSPKSFTTSYDSKEELPIGSSLKTYNFHMTRAKVAEALGIDYSQVQVDQVSTNQLISMDTELLADYDCIYIGGDTTALDNEDWWAANEIARETGYSGSLNLYQMYTHTGSWYYVSYNKATANADGFLSYTASSPLPTWENMGDLLSLGQTNSASLFYHTNSGVANYCDSIGVYNGNDITYLVYDMLREYVNAGMPVVIEKDVLSASGSISSEIDPDSYMYQFLDYVKSGSYANVLTGFNQNDTSYKSGGTGTRSISNAGYQYGITNTSTVTVFDESNAHAFKTLIDENCNLRPILTLYKYPQNYDYDHPETIQEEHTLSFNFSAGEDSTSYYQAYLYVDTNGDDVFNKNLMSAGGEAILMAEQTGRIANKSFEYDLGDGFFGLIYWEIEVVRYSDSTKTNETGRMAYSGYTDIKRSPTQPKQEIKVLEIIPRMTSEGGLRLVMCIDCQQAIVNGATTWDNSSSHVHTFGVANYHEDRNKDYVSSEAGYNLCDVLTDYEISLDIWTPAQFDARFRSLSSSTGTAFDAAVDALYQEYDMIICGFAECYGGGDLSIRSCQVIAAYADEGGNLLCTHDLSSGEPLTGRSITTKYGQNITYLLRETFGMDRFAATGANTGSGSTNRLVWTPTATNVAGGTEFFTDYGYIPRNNRGSSAGRANLLFTSGGLTDAYASYVGVGRKTYNRYPYKYMNSGSSNTDGWHPAANATAYSWSSPWSATSRPITNVKKVNDGIVTMFPFTIPDEITISGTHTQYYALDMEAEDLTVWYTLGTTSDPDSIIYAASPYDGRSNYYIYTRGNITYSGAGHSRMTGNGTNNLQERKLFINTVIKSINRINRAPVVTLLEHADANLSFTDSDGNPLTIPEVTVDSMAGSAIKFNFTVSDDLTETTIKQVFIFSDVDADGVYEPADGDVLLKTYEGATAIGNNVEVAVRDILTSPGVFYVDNPIITVLAVDNAGKKGFAQFKLVTGTFLFDLTYQESQVFVPENDMVLNKKMYTAA